MDALVNFSTNFWAHILPGFGYCFLLIAVALYGIRSGEWRPQLVVSVLACIIFSKIWHGTDALIQLLGYRVVPDNRTLLTIMQIFVAAIIYSRMHHLLRKALPGQFGFFLDEKHELRRELYRGRVEYVVDTLYRDAHESYDVKRMDELTAIKQNLQEKSAVADYDPSRRIDLLNERNYLRNHLEEMLN